MTDTEQRHSPLPWVFEEDAFFIADANNKGVIDAVKATETNAALIVKCVNEHPALIAENKALREALRDIRDLPFETIEPNGADIPMQTELDFQRRWAETWQPDENGDLNNLRGDVVGFCGLSGVPKISEVT